MLRVCRNIILCENISALEIYLFIAVPPTRRNNSFAIWCNSCWKCGTSSKPVAAAVVVLMAELSALAAELSATAEELCNVTAVLGALVAGLSAVAVGELVELQLLNVLL
jgi:hypothetical protein